MSHRIGKDNRVNILWGIYQILKAKLRSTCSDIVIVNVVECYSWASYCRLERPVRITEDIISPFFFAHWTQFRKYWPLFIKLSNFEGQSDHLVSSLRGSETVMHLVQLSIIYIFISCFLVQISKNSKIKIHLFDKESELRYLVFFYERKHKN